MDDDYGWVWLKISAKLYYYKVSTNIHIAKGHGVKANLCVCNGLL